FDAALNPALVNQVGVVLGVAYPPSEWLDVGAEGVLHYAALSNLALNVRADLRARTATPHKDEFANDNQLRFGGFAVARLAPIYGKFNLASEIKVHFQAYLLGGAGVASVHRESVNLCADAGTATCQNYQQTNATKGVAEV